MLFITHRLNKLNTNLSLYVFSTNKFLFPWIIENNECTKYIINVHFSAIHEFFSSSFEHCEIKKITECHWKCMEVDWFPKRTFIFFWKWKKRAWSRAYVNDEICKSRGVTFIRANVSVISHWIDRNSGNDRIIRKESTTLLCVEKRFLIY